MQRKKAGVETTLQDEVFDPLCEQLTRLSDAGEASTESEPLTLPASQSFRAGWDMRWSREEIWQDFPSYLKLDSADETQRRDQLISNGFKQVRNRSKALRGVTVFEKTHNGILREQHRFTTQGVHSRRLEILDDAGSGLEVLTKAIKTATKGALRENKRQKDYVSWQPLGIRWRAESEEEWYDRHLPANKKLRDLMLRNQELIRALQVYDTLSPMIAAISLEPMRNAPSSIKKAYLDFIAVLVRVDEIVERAGAPTRTDALSVSEQQLAEDMHRKRKGTEKGSVNYIASEIGIKCRKYSVRAWKEKGSALVQAVKRHLRRRRLALGT